VDARHKAGHDEFGFGMLAFIALWGRGPMLITRYAKIVMAACLALFSLLVTFDNLTDYGTNYLFVEHVLSMDTTFPGNALMYRSITSPVIWQLAYAAIIAAEGVTGVLFLAGAIRLFQLRNAPAIAFNQGKGLVIAACLLAFLVWFLGFMVVAGEWFAMWQSQTWNGQDAAFRFYVTVLAVLIFVNQTDIDLPEPDASMPEADERPKRRRTDKPPARRRTDKPTGSET
jgi:predicted small integral membrane protein